MHDGPDRPGQLEWPDDSSRGQEARDEETGDPVLDLPAAGAGDWSPAEEPPPPPRSGTLTVIVIGGFILLVSAAVLWWWYGSRGDARPQESGPPATAAAEPEASEPAGDRGAGAGRQGSSSPLAPDLATSDPLVREIVAGLSRHAEWATFLVSEELALNLVRLVGAVAFDDPPQGSLEALRPDDGFSVIRRGQRLFPAETSYRRYDLAVDVLDSIDLGGVASAYARLLPLLEKGHDELGYPGEFGDTLERAITRLLETPAPESPPELSLRVISFEFADPKLEALAPAQKMLLRLGPENGQRVRTKVRELYAAIDP